MSVQAQFDKAVAIVKNLPKDGPVKPSQDDQLNFYAHYKQATEGDCTTAAPGMFDFVGKAKHKAWTALKGMDKEAAKEKYVALLLDVLKKTDDDESKKYVAELEAAKTA